MAKSRSEREAELNAMIRSDSGRFELGRLYRTAIGKPEGETLPVGMLYGDQMVKAILDHEFPPDR